MQDEENTNEDIEFEEDGDTDAGANPSALIKKLRTRAREAESKAADYLTGWQKERAEGVNIRKRTEEEKKEFAKYANEKLIEELLPAMDSFDMAMKNKEEWQKLPKNWTSGIEYIYTQFLSALESNGVKRVYPLGETFDPQRDEALDTIETGEKADDHKILEVIQPGYTYQGKTLRTAKVKVAELKG
jgi:molecular chaperone GrpE